MRKVTEVVDWKCDICGDEAVTAVSYPIVFKRELNPDRVFPLTIQQQLDLCPKCCDKVLMVDGGSYYTPSEYVEYTLRGII